MQVTSFLFFVFLTAFLHGVSGKQKIVCYFINWAWYRSQPGNLLPEDVDPNLCTHINYAFAILDKNELILKPSDEWADINNKFFQTVNSLKSLNPDLKTLISLGGWEDSRSNKYSQLVNDSTKRKNFIAQVIKFLKQYDFDGLDIDWEYPKCWQGNCTAGPGTDKENFATWIRELREAFDAEEKHYLLTAAVKADGEVLDVGYDIPSITRDLDFINVMTYDFHNYMEGVTGHHAQFDFRPEDPPSTPTVISSAKAWIKRGASKKKLVIGIPAYGRSFRLTNPENNGLGAPTSGPGNPGNITKGSGTLGFYEICINIKNGWNKAGDHSVGSWAYENDQWVSYDDLEDASRKAKWASSEGFGGVMVWDVSTDDTKATCCTTKFPFLKAMNYGNSGEGSPPSTYGCP